MTITKANAINEKIIDLTKKIMRYRLRVCFILDKPSRIAFEWLSSCINNLDYACESCVEGFVFEKEYGCESEDVTTYKYARKYIEQAVEERIKVRDDIPLGELSLWIDLFALIY